MPDLATCIFLIFYKEQELGAEIYPGMVLTPLPSSIYRDRTHDLTIVSRVLYRLITAFDKTKSYLVLALKEKNPVAGTHIKA